MYLLIEGQDLRLCKLCTAQAKVHVLCMYKYKKQLNKIEE